MQEVAEEVEALGLSDVVEFKGLVPLEAIAEAIEKADVGIVPNRRTPFTELNFPQRIFEYLCKGKPVISCRTRGILDYFDEESLCYFNPGSHEDLARVILELWRDTEQQERLVKRGYLVFYPLRWALQEKKLIRLVDGLIQGKEIAVANESWEDHKSSKL